MSLNDIDFPCFLSFLSLFCFIPIYEKSDFDDLKCKVLVIYFANFILS